MERETLIEKLKCKIASIGWKMFLWGNSLKQEEYWERIYQQEKDYKKINGIKL